MSALGDMLALVDFRGQLEDELTLKAGEIVRNVKKTGEEGWLEGESDGKRGLFPQIFVKEIPSFFLNDNGQRFPRSIRKVNACPQQKKQRWCRAEYSYSPSKPDELELIAGEVVEVIEEIEDGWWLGKKGNLVGAFPSNFVQEISEPLPDKAIILKKTNKQRPKMMDINFIPTAESTAKQDDKAAVNNIKDSSSGPVSISEFARVMFDYVSTLPDELSLKKGDVVAVISKETEDEGWWRGEVNGKSGLFPDNFVILIPPDSQIKASKPPTRTSTLKGQVTKVDTTATELKPPMNKSQSPSASSTAQKVAKMDTATMDLKSSANRPQSPGPNSAGQKEPKENKVDSAPKMAHQPGKKAAPPPPIPAKTKPSTSQANKPAAEPQTKAAEEKKERNKETNNTTMDGLKISSVKLVHPTADRPKMQGKRLPKNKAASSGNESVSNKEENQMNSHVKSPTTKNTPKFSNPSSQANSPTAKTNTNTHSANVASKKSPESVPNVQVEELMEEVKALKLMMEIIKKKHSTDIQEIRSEISQERVKRLALQMEIENLKKLSSS